MPEFVDCLNLERWRAIFNGHLSEEQCAIYEQHLESCAVCQSRLHQAEQCDDDLMSLARRLGDPTAAPVNRALTAVLEQLYQDTLPESSAAERIDLSFQRPANRPDILGTLGHYQVQAVIGQGGMGVVLRAFDPVLHRVVAIKVLAPALAGNAIARQRFIREARAAAAINHDHVVAVHGVHDVDGLPYLVMHYIAGESLHDRLDREGSLPLADVIRIARQTASGLAAAHAQGLIHRDIKPANLLLEGQLGTAGAGGIRVKITDFGLARTVDEVGLTQNGVIAGTPEYMAPEQARGEPLNHRADLFSLGSVLYALCTGQPPFQADSSYGILRLVADHEPRPIRELNPEIPEWLCAIVGKLMAKHPEDRFATAGEVAELLGGNVEDPALPTRTPVLQLSTRLPEAMGNRPEREGRRRSVPPSWLLVLVGSMTLLSGVAFWLTGMGGSRANPAGALLELPEEEISLSVWTVAFSPDGTRLVTGGGRHARPGQFQIWDVATQKPLISRWVHRGVRAVVYSPDGKILATGHWGGDIKLRDALTANEQTQLIGHARGINCLAFSADGALLASAGLDQLVKIWDVKARRERQQPLRHKGLVFSVAFFHHGHALLTSGDDGVARIWDLDTGKERFSLRGHTARQVEAVAIAPDDRILATGCWDGTIKLWDPETGTATATLKQEADWVLAIAFSPDGRLLASAGSDGMVCVWEVASRKLLASIRQHGWFARAVAFSPDGKLLASGGEDKTARLWNVATGEDVAVLPAGSTELTPDTPADARSQAESKGRADAAAFKSGMKNWLTGLGLALLVPVAVILVVWLSLRRNRRVRDKPEAAKAAENLPPVRFETRFLSPPDSPPSPSVEANRSIPETLASALVFACSACGASLRMRTDWTAKKVRCPRCGQTILVPEVKPPTP